MLVSAHVWVVSRGRVAAGGQRVTLSQLLERDARIAALDALGTRRTQAETAELAKLLYARDLLWRRLVSQLAVARRRVFELEEYMREHRLPVSA